MSFIIRPARSTDIDDLHRLASSLSAQGFLTLPSDKGELECAIALSEQSFRGTLQDPDQGKFLFVLEDRSKGGVVGASLIIARHGTPESPHLYLDLDFIKGTLKLRSETEGRTELGGLILDPAYRGRPEKLGRSLSYVRLDYIGRNPARFRKALLAELLPPFAKDGKSYLWESLGRKWTGLDYREADRLSRKDKRFFLSCLPKDEIPISSLTAEAQATIGKPGPQTGPVARILTEAGFHTLNQIDPFDGGPHYGALQGEVRQEIVSEFFSKAIGKGVTFYLLK